ncbi:hypothetical protein [Sorangium sp. So ce385]|uniref:hypothetical protein n=1 Tax=Sorangium sp. So ce385 TaxID=3133308 RepID=UPI003F5C3F87
MDDKSLRAIQNFVQAFGADSRPVTFFRTLAEIGSRAIESAELRNLLSEALIAFQAAEAAVARFEKKGAEMAEAAHARGLIVPSSQMNLHDLTRLTDVYETQGATAVVSAIETEYERIFGAPEFLGSLRESWMASNLLAPRWPILNDALKAHTYGLFGASVPALIAQAEGIIVDLRQYTGKVNGPTLQTLLKETVDGDPFTGPLVTSFFRNVLHAAFQHGAAAGLFSRHAILHGGDLQYPSERNSRTSILLIDVLLGYEADTLTSPTSGSATT